MYAGKKVVRGVCGKNAAPVRRFSPQTGPPLFVKSINFYSYFNFGRG